MSSRGSDGAGVRARCPGPVKATRLCVVALDKSIDMATAAIEQVHRDYVTEASQRAILRCVHEARLELLAAEQVGHVPA